MAVVERVGRGRGARRAFPRGRGQGEGEGERRRGRGKCTLEEAVGIGRQWERSRESLELRKGEDAGEEEESHGMDGKEDRARGSRDRETAEVGVKNPTRN